MALISKLFKYFIYFPLLKLIFYVAIKLKGKNFVNLFNLYSFLSGTKNRISFKENSYFCSEFDWKFSYKTQGLYAYGKGFQKRIQELKSSYLIKKINFMDNDIIIDIGANNGDFYLCFEKKIKYYAFEPSPAVFSNLIYNVKKQELFNKGVWKSSDKNITFYLSDEFGDSSILPIKNFSQKVKIETTTLDIIFNNINKPIKLLKLEAEGSEPEILEGLKQNINQVNYITIDCGFERGNEQSSTISDCSNYLIRNNFKMIDFSSERTVALYENQNFKL